MSSLELFASDWREVWKHAATPEPVGAVFTRPEIVDLILDLAGYAVGNVRLAEISVLEPSCGDGAFLDAVIGRLIQSEVALNGRVIWEDPILVRAVCACDINEKSVQAARSLVEARLTAAGCVSSMAAILASKWVIHTDFLLHPWVDSFGLIVGNPPYVRVEDLPKPVLAEYRRRFGTATDRADLYVAFFEQGLRLLADDGVLAFISANRFAKNQYGAPLRRLIAKKFHVRHYVNLEHTQPFMDDVSAYPAVVVIDRAAGTSTRASTLDDIAPGTLATIREESKSEVVPSKLVSVFPDWYPDGAPWRATSSADHSLMESFERDYPTLERSAVGTKVGIGVATGADEVFVLDELSTKIERTRQIPLLMAQDVRSEHPKWSGHYLVNPFDAADDGALVHLEELPGLKDHMERFSDRLNARHVARTRPRNWYRTIDRIWPALQYAPKLVIPDIQRGGVVGLDEGQFYPHHNLYWITSDGWNLRALQALLRSSFVLRQVRAFSVQMRGGSVRYQAQTLRKLRVPAFTSLSDECVARLVRVATSTDQREIDEAASAAYGLPAAILLAS